MELLPVAVKPFDWISWWEARARMPSIWAGWHTDRPHADQAMVNALRRGQVHSRGPDGAAHRHRFQLIGALETVQSISLTGSTTALVTFVACYEFPSISDPAIIASRPIQVTAEFVNPELVWDEFRNELIRFELPAEATPRHEGQLPPRLHGEALDDELDRWAQSLWGDDLTKLPDRDQLLILARIARLEFRRVTQQDIRNLRARLAPDKIKKGGSRMHRRA
jgi:hypothetical protein